MLDDLELRNERAPERLVMIRLGRNTLIDTKLEETSIDTFDNWFLFGFSVYGLPDSGYEGLTRVVPFVALRQWVMEASSRALLDAGFPTLATKEAPHWTVVLSEPTPTQFARVRRFFSEPKQNSAWRRYR